MRPIYLIGFMCSGKTTLGRALSHRLGIEFVDLDLLIEQRAGMSVRQIFDTLGEAEFRRMEADTLREVSQREDLIVACGGGTPCQPGAMELMNATGMTVRLAPSERRLVHRLMAGRRKRPLIASIQTPAEMHDFLVFTNAKREPYYGKARYRFDSSWLDSDDEIARSVEAFIGQLLPGAAPGADRPEKT